MSLSLLRLGKLASMMKFDLATRTLVAATTNKKTSSPPKQPKQPKQAQTVKPPTVQSPKISVQELRSFLANPVVRPPSAFNIYVKEKYDDLKKDRPDLSSVQLMKLLSEKWSNMDPDAKALYSDAAKAEKSQRGEAYLNYRNFLSQHVQLGDMLKSLRKAGLTKRVSRGVSGFNLYCRENYPNASGSNLGERMRSLAASWSRTPESLKLEYNDRAHQQSRA